MELDYLRCSHNARPQKDEEGAARCPPCSRNAHDKRNGMTPVLCSLAPGAEEGMEPDDLLCSRNARPQKALVGRAQWKIDQAPSLKR